LLLLLLLLLLRLLRRLWLRLRLLCERRWGVLVWDADVGVGPVGGAAGVRLQHRGRRGHVSANLVLAAVGLGRLRLRLRLRLQEGHLIDVFGHPRARVRDFDVVVHALGRQHSFERAPVV
jgi:hypothetical protein